MHPKTYFIRLHRPFGELTLNPYLMYLHAESPFAALMWVARVFEGIDVQTTMNKWQAPAPAVPRVGCNDPVTVHDCDLYRSRKRVNGSLVTQPLEPGHFRRSQEEVTQDLLKVFHHLQDERTRALASFEHFRRNCEVQERAWYFERMEQLKHNAQKALVWQANVWAEYLKSQQALTLELPVRAALAA